MRGPPIFAGEMSAIGIVCGKQGLYWAPEGPIRMSESSEQSSVGQSSNGGGAAVKSRPAPARRTPTETLPPWNVILHNDDVNEMLFVVESLCRFARLSVPAATRCTMEAHKKGISLVLATHREHAELVAEQLTSLRLTVTIEPAV